MRPRRCQDQAGALARPLAQGEDGPGAAFARQVDIDIQPLPHREAKAAAVQRLHAMPVHRDQPGPCRARIDPEDGRGGGVDDAQSYPPAALNPDNFRVGKRPVIGKIGVPVVIVQIHLHDAGRHDAARHAAHHRPHVLHCPHAGHCHSAVHAVHAVHSRHAGIAIMPGPDFVQNLLGRSEREIMQEKHHFLPVAGQILGRPDDQRCREKPHFLRRDMAVHPVCAGQRREIIRSPLSRHQRRHGQVRHAVLRIWRDLPMPVDDRRHVQFVAQIDAEALAGFQCQPLTLWAGEAKDSGRAPVDIERAGRGPEGKGRALPCPRQAG